MTPSQFLRNPDKIASPLSVLRREYADSRAVPELIDGVEDIHDVKADCDRLAVGLLEFVRNADIGRSVGRNMVGVGETAAQAAAVHHARAEPRALPEVGRAGRAGPLLRVIGVDVVAGDIGELVGAEQILVRHDVGGDLPGPGEIAVSAEIAVLVGRTQFDAAVIGLFVVEAAENKRRAELSVVQQGLAISCSRRRDRPRAAA